MPGFAHVIAVAVLSVFNTSILKWACHAVRASDGLVLGRASACSELVFVYAAADWSRYAVLARGLRPLMTPCAHVLLCLPAVAVGDC
jgi:hypothetical protein